jgi:hypothetical protein
VVFRITVDWDTSQADDFRMRGVEPGGSARRHAGTGTRSAFLAMTRLARANRV